MAFQENLKKIREQNGYTGKDFAALLEISYPTYMSYENKGREPKYELLVKMADILKVTPNTLLGVKDPKFTPDEQNLIKKYRILDERGKILTNNVIDSQIEAIYPKAEDDAG